MYYAKLSNADSVLSLHKISRAFQESSSSVTPPTVSSYIEYLESAFGISKLKKLSWSSYSVFDDVIKYYPVDNGLSNTLSVNRLSPINGKTIENIVFNQIRYHQLVLIHLHE